MPLEFKKRFKENLKLIPVYIEDNSSTSDEYFGIKEFPSFFGRGKNAIRIKPSRFTLKANSQIYIEILDINGESIYYEIPDYEPGDLSRYISAWVYGERDDSYNTPNGVGEIILCGIAERTAIGGDIPEEFKNVLNIRWRRRFSISRDVRTESPIVFFNQNAAPTITVSESLAFYKEIPAETSLQLVTQSINQTIVYSSDFSGQNVFLETPSYQLNQNSVGGQIKINLQNVSLTPQLTSAEISAGMLKPLSYTASIQSFLTSRKFRVDRPLTASAITKTESLQKTFTAFSTGSFILETINTGSATTFSQSLAHITVKNINPLVGNIDKINVYIKSKATGDATTEYQLIGTKLINESITGSLTDIYSDTKTNLTESTYTFIFNPPNKNTANDIKVEYLNSLNDFANYESVLYNHYFQGYNAQSTGGGDITELSQSLSSLSDIVIDVSGSLITTNSKLTSVSSSLITTDSKLTSVSSSLITTDSKLTSVSSSLITTNSKLTSVSSSFIDVSSSLITTNSKLTSVSSSLVTTNSALTSVSSSLLIVATQTTEITNVIKDIGDSRLGLNLTGVVWTDTTPPTTQTLVEENQNDWIAGTTPIIRNPNRNGLALNGVLADPDGFLQIRLQQDLTGASGIEDAIIFLPYYSSSYTS